MYTRGTASRKDSTRSMKEDINGLYQPANSNLNKFMIMEGLNSERSIRSKDEDEDIEADCEWCCECCVKLQKKPCWKPFKRAMLFLLHVVLVLVGVIVGAMFLAEIEDPIPEDTNSNSGSSDGTNGTHINGTSYTATIKLLQEFNKELNEQEKKEFLNHIQQYLNQLKIKEEAEKRKDRWFIFVKWIYFVTVSCTTIGYGDVAPKTNNGRFFYMLYSIFGVPLMMSLLRSCGVLITAVNKKFFKLLIRCCCSKKMLVSEQLLSAISVFILFLGYLSFGCLLNAAIGRWTLFKSIYYLIVTFTTVGFGDVTHTLEDQVQFFVPLLIYRIFGLAMLAAVIDSILQYASFRSKDLKKKRLEMKRRLSRRTTKRSSNENNNNRHPNQNKLKIRNRGLTFDARIHETIFGDGEDGYRESSDSVSSSASSA